MAGKRVAATTEGSGLGDGRGDCAAGCDSKGGA